MKIVMVHDCAFVGYELRRELMKRGFDVDHLFFSGSAKIATLRMALKLRRFECTLIHAHSCHSAAYASYASGKPFIVHCHGSDIRWGMNWLKKRCLKKARKVLVSTPDLLGILPYATWLPNPVDTERFKPLREHNGNKVLYFPHWYEDVSDFLKKLCERFDFNLTIQKTRSVPYARMHEFLNRFDAFVDQFSIESYSKTALEAMACGLPVIGYRHDLKETLEKLTSKRERQKLVREQNRKIISKHKAEHVVKQLIKIYSELNEQRRSHRSPEPNRFIQIN